MKTDYSGDLNTGRQRCGDTLQRCSDIRDTMRRESDNIQCSSIPQLISRHAAEALAEEVYTTPKPGLVDLYSDGAHKDMTVSTFLASASALEPYFAQMAMQGLTASVSEEELFRQIRVTGMEAERAMYGATGGVNTHKGLIFTMGIFSAAAGRCIQKTGTVQKDALLAIEQRMCADTLRKELEASCSAAQLRGEKVNTLSTVQSHGEKVNALNTAQSHGEKVNALYHSGGIREEAILGYPSVFGNAYPVYCAGIAEGKAENLVKVQTLLTAMTCAVDSNVLYRCGVSGLQRIRADASKLLESSGAYNPENIRRLYALDSEYTKLNLSPGGCADILATCIFLHRLLHMQPAEYGSSWD